MFPADVLIASSSSGLTMSGFNRLAACYPERCVHRYPFNPPPGAAGRDRWRREDLGSDHRARRGIPRGSASRAVAYARKCPSMCQSLAGALGARFTISSPRAVISVADVKGAVMGAGLRWGHHGAGSAQIIWAADRAASSIFEQFTKPMTLVEGMLARADASYARNSSIPARGGRLAHVAELEAHATVCSACSSCAAVKSRQ